MGDVLPSGLADTTKVGAEDHKRSEHDRNAEKTQEDRGREPHDHDDQADDEAYDGPPYKTARVLIDALGLDPGGERRVMPIQRLLHLIEHTLLFLGERHAHPLTVPGNVRKLPLQSSRKHRTHTTSRT
jgi:hypothetical protein